MGCGVGCLVFLWFALLEGRLEVAQGGSVLVGDEEEARVKATLLSRVATTSVREAMRRSWSWLMGEHLAVVSNGSW